jgi:hypothetical protein
MTTDREPLPAQDRPETGPGRADTHRPLAARILVSMSAAFTMVGAYVADFNETHLFNPRWPPHARFHNAQTMLLATALGACALLYTWRRDPNATHLRTAILFASLYWITNAGSITFPGTAWTDPEHAGQGQLLGLPAALVIGVMQLGLLAAALVMSRPDGRRSPLSPSVEASARTAGSVLHPRNG